MRSTLVFILIIGFFFSGQAWAQPDLGAMQSQISELSQMVRDLKQTVEKQQLEIAELRKDFPAQPPFAPDEDITTSQRSGAQFVPEIGVVGDVVFRSDSPKTDGGGSDRVSVREMELILGGSVGPHSHFDSTIAFTDEGAVELEEAYFTGSELPLDITARAGRFKPSIGKVLAFHHDALDTVDEPLVIQRYFGAEGLSKTGVDFTKSMGLPWPVEHQLTLGILEGGNGEDGTAFGETKRRPTIYGHLKNYLDISDTTNLEIGLSDAIGSRDADSAMEVNVFGVDGTLIHHLNPNQNIKLQGEVFNLNRSESQLETVDDTTGAIFLNDVDGNVWGGYALLDFRIHSKWAAGFRYDQVQIVNRPADSPEQSDQGYSGYLTFYQSEFMRWRAQVSHFDLTDGSEDNQIFLQGTFTVGEHHGGGH